MKPPFMMCGKTSTPAALWPRSRARMFVLYNSFSAARDFASIAAAVSAEALPSGRQIARASNAAKRGVDRVQRGFIAAITVGDAARIYRTLVVPRGGPPPLLKLLTSPE